MFNPLFFCFAWTAICIFLGREGSFYGISVLGLSARFVLAGHNGVPYVKKKNPLQPKSQGVNITARRRVL